MGKEEAKGSGTVAFAEAGNQAAKRVENRRYRTISLFTLSKLNHPLRSPWPVTYGCRIRNLIWFVSRLFVAVNSTVVSRVSSGLPWEEIAAKKRGTAGAKDTDARFDSERGKEPKGAAWLEGRVENPGGIFNRDSQAAFSFFGQVRVLANPAVGRPGPGRRVVATSNSDRAGRPTAGKNQLALAGLRSPSRAAR
jgi:hypothetical protein